MPKLSEKQQKITELRNCNILVSAAAGSGKTSVLVTRILKRITDDIDPIDIDRVLVLTFTKAAAGSLRSRIAEGIADLIEKNPDDERLKRQAGLIYNAQISTIDSFCLNILRNNFTEIGLEPGFRVADPKEIKLLEDEVMDEVIEEVLLGRTSDEGIKVNYLEDFLEQFESKDSLKKVRETISDMYTEADKAPFIEDFIEARRADYAVSDVADIENSPWFAEYMRFIRNSVSDALEKNRQMREFCETNGPEKYLSLCDSDREKISKLSVGTDYESIRDAAKGITWDSLPRLTKEETAQGGKEEAAAIRKSYKDLISKIAKEYLAYSLEVEAEYMKKTGRAVNALLDIVWQYHLKLTEKKKDKGIWTFSDVEHMALRILLKKEGGSYVPTQVALDYRNVYRELMIDEYQDSNRMQEWLIHAISGEDDGIFDRFIVGDVKQSIYRFRNADPTLFMEKYYEYTPDEGDLTRIDLSTNYRSRTQVLDTVNAVFEKVMDREIGGVDYDEANRLNYGGVFDDGDTEQQDDEDPYLSELMVLFNDKENDLNIYEQEAMLLSRRIKKLIKEQLIFNKETKEFRSCEYRDIVILMRSIPSEIEDMRHILEANGIPVHTPSRGGYFDANEIVTVLNYLKILNNPHDDIAFFGTLKSVFGGFDENEISVISLAGSNLYEGMRNISAVCPEEGSFDDNLLPDRLKAADHDEIRLISAKAAGFLEDFDFFRGMIPYTPVYKLIRTIYDRYDYVEYVSAMPAGGQRKANVLALLSKAEDYTGNGFVGIFDFCRYIDRLKKYESDEGEVLTLGENDNVVRIMTMHKSKGLEFPICILSGLHKRFNMSDSSARLVFDPEFGMGIDPVDAKKRIKLKSMRKRFISDRIKRETISEEMRVLYVAMTRAEEKLIMSAVINPKDEGSAEYHGNPGEISERMNINSFYKILDMTRGNNDWNGQCRADYYHIEDIEHEEANELGNEGIRRETFEKNMTSVSPQDVVSANELKNIIIFKYPHKELENLYTKTSVSELKMAAIHEGLIKDEKYDIPDQFFKLHDEEAYVPAFARTEKETEQTGAAIGSAVHRVMELIDHTYMQEFTVDTLDDQMKEHIESGALAASDYELVNKSKIVSFVNSDMGIRMRKAAAEGKLYKEKPFVLGISADRLDERFPKDETVLIQGIIDVFFIEDDHIVLLDYKTDSVKAGDELILRYKTQMDYYEEALRRIIGSDVSERILYSFALEEAVSC